MQVHLFTYTTMESKATRVLSPPAKRVVPSGMNFEYSALRQMLRWRNR